MFQCRKFDLASDRILWVVSKCYTPCLPNHVCRDTVADNNVLFIVASWCTVAVKGEVWS